MRSNELVSASGLRPLSAFVVIGVVVLLVAVRVGGLTFLQDRGASPLSVREERERAPAYAIEDAAGRPLARFVPRMGLVLSPRAMWQAHTPARIASGLAAILASDPAAIGSADFEAGPESPSTDELLRRLLPDMRDGAIDVRDLSLSPKQAVRVAAFLEHGNGGEGDDRPLPGVELVPDTDQLGRYRLRWQPLVVLAPETRAAQDLSAPIRFSRFLADGLAAALLGDDAFQRGDSLALLTAQRRDVWSRLMPRGHVRAIERIEPQHALAIQEFLRDEKVLPHQMSVEVDRERAYPQGEDLTFLGDWGFLPAGPEGRTQVDPVPRSGLERRCFELLASPDFGGLFAEGGGYRYVRTRAVRRGEAPRSYFIQSWKAGVPPVFRTTIDVQLQRFVRRQLDQLLADHRPALAMAIVVDVASGAILALDSVREYGIQDYAPAQHQFTPGSTFKLVTMALALDEGVVRPDEPIDVGNGVYRLVEHRDDGSVRGSRLIREAEGHKTGTITAAECLAHSMNAGLVQIGLRVESPRFRARMLELGYGSSTELGLVAERPGLVPALERDGEWKFRFTHASVTFGHEIATTLVQHAQALATILRGGAWKPVYMLDSVRSGDAVYGIEPLEERRVFGAEACADVRDMMRLGAREGTGRKVWRDAFDLGTKTGTAEKISTEVCVHEYERAAVEAMKAGRPFGRSEYAALRRGPTDDHESCYTSSMCLFGREVDGDGGRELMVLVVADEPRGDVKYGSDVAGQAGIKILEEALGRTRGGREPVASVAPGFAPSASTQRNAFAEPWLEELR